MISTKLSEAGQRVSGPVAAEFDGLLPQDTELAQQTNVPDVFGATTEDTQGLRIVSLYEVCSHGCANLAPIKLAPPQLAQLKSLKSVLALAARAALAAQASVRVHQLSWPCMWHVTITVRIFTLSGGVVILF